METHRVDTLQLLITGLGGVLGLIIQFYILFTTHL